MLPRLTALTHPSRRILVLSFAILALCAAGLSLLPASAPAANHPYVVVIDAGHQAKANMKSEPIGPGSRIKKPSVAGGTSGVVTHKAESLINLQVALKLQKQLQARGVKVIMIRTTQKANIPNSKRAAIANAAHADLLIRLHCDAAGSKTRGVLTLVPGTNKWTGPIVKPSAKAGSAIHKAVLRATGAQSRGITRRTDMAGFNWSKVPSVIVEMGVMTNKTDDRLLASTAYQNKLATGMSNGIMTYLSGK
jgi:N-acetylmuramoyl-L-alanine amidase